MKIETISDFRAAIRQGPYAWPGGYPLFFLMSDGEAMSFESAKAERRAILEALRDNSNDGWKPVAFEINWEDCELICCHSNKPIPCAYDSEVQS